MVGAGGGAPGQWVPAPVLRVASVRRWLFWLCAGPARQVGESSPKSPNEWCHRNSARVSKSRASSPSGCSLDGGRGYSQRDMISETLKFHLHSLPLAGAVGYLAAGNERAYHLLPHTRRLPHRCSPRALTTRPCAVWAAHRAMAKRKPMSVPKALLALYNAAQVLINLYVAVHLASAVRGRVWGVGQEDTDAVRLGVYLHYLCKYLDMADTAIICARKKEAQLSFLHLYHHSTIVVVWGWVRLEDVCTLPRHPALWRLGGALLSAAARASRRSTTHGRPQRTAAPPPTCTAPGPTPPPPTPPHPPPRRDRGLPMISARWAYDGGRSSRRYGAWINSCVHVVMYAYYGLTALEIRPPPRLKRAVTAFQLTQFASCILQARRDQISEIRDLITESLGELG